MVVLWIGIGLLVLIIGVAAITDLRDRGRGGSRKVMMPSWASRRLGHTETDLIYGSGRPKSPREEIEEHQRRYKGKDE